MFGINKVTIVPASRCVESSAGQRLHQVVALCSCSKACCNTNTQIQPLSKSQERLEELFQTEAYTRGDNMDPEGFYPVWQADQHWKQVEEVKMEAEDNRSKCQSEQSPGNQENSSLSTETVLSNNANHDWLKIHKTRLHIKNIWSD